MNVARRIEIGGILALVVAGLALAGAGSALALAGLQLPAQLAGPLSVAGDVLGWVRWLVVAGLVFSVRRARENGA